MVFRHDTGRPSDPDRSADHGRDRAGAANANSGIEGALHHGSRPESDPRTGRASDLPQPARARRAAWMGVMATAEPAALASAYAALGELPAYRSLRASETGMAMVRGRAGGTGAQFNLGEVSVTRCSVVFDGGVVGSAYVRGRAPRHAEQAAVLDGLLQMPGWQARVQDGVIEPLARSHAARAAEKAAVAAQTRVDFSTMVRGED